MIIIISSNWKNGEGLYKAFGYASKGLVKVVTAPPIFINNVYKAYEGFVSGKIRFRAVIT